MTAPWDWPWPWSLLSVVAVGVLIPVAAWNLGKWSARRSARYRAQHFAQYEQQPTGQGMRTYWKHRVRLHTIDFNIRAPRGCQFHCLTCDVRWWW
jgi:hypothetical protein